MTWTWEYFIDRDGTNPVKEFLAKLKPPDHVAAKLETILRVHIVSREGSLMEKKFILKPIEELWQIRANDCRIIGMVHPNRRCHFVLVHSFVKKSDKTPPGELSAARRNWNRYRELEAIRLQEEQRLQARAQNRK